MKKGKKYIYRDDGSEEDIVEGMAKEKAHSQIQTRYINGHRIDLHFADKPQPGLYSKIRRILLNGIAAQNRNCTFETGDKI